MKRLINSEENEIFRSGRHRRSSWFRKLNVHILLPFVFMTVFVVILLTVLVSRIYTKTILDQEDEKNNAAFQYIASNITSSITESRNAIPSIIADNTVVSYLRQDYRTTKGRMLSRIACVNYLRGEINNQRDIYGLLFLREDGSMFGVLPYRNVFFDCPTQDIFSEEQVNQIQHLDRGKTVWLGPLSGSDIYFGINDPKYPQTVMVSAWKMVNVSYGNSSAIMLVDDSIFKGYLNTLEDGVSTLHLITEDDAEFIQCGEKGTLTKEQLLKVPEGGTILKNAKSESVYVYSSRLPELNWNLIREMPMEMYERNLRQMRLTVWLVAALVFLIALFIYLLWLKRFMRNFDTLKTGIIQLGEGHLETQIDQPLNVEEFENIRQEFNQMNLSLNRHIDQIRKMEHDQLELEMRNLQTVLSPHMVFNSISAIRWMASIMDAEPVSDALGELAKMLRPMFREWKIKWTIREELDHLQHYTKLLDLRYGNNFKLECDVPEELNDSLLPRFTLQPLVENACEHGGNPEEALVVTVRVWEENGWIHMTVKNNGQSISQEEITAIREMLQSGKHGHSIGLYNVYTRIKMCMGEDSKFDISCPPEGGTVVSIQWEKQS